MKNGFEVRGPITAIVLRRSDGSTMETLIDTKDLPIAQSISGTWCAAWQSTTRSFVVSGKTGRGNTRRNVKLHRLIVGEPAGLVVDHLNHDTLDNRRSNLRALTNAENQQNRTGAQRNNLSSGIRGVSFDRREGKWAAQVVLAGRKRHVGYFDGKTDAALAVSEARRQMMPFSQADRVANV